MTSPLLIVDLRCEYRLNPLGIDVVRPRLSWRLDEPGARRSIRQSAFQIRVASSAEALADGGADLWDSGRVGSDRSIQVEYEGCPLVSRQRAWWTVRVWEAGQTDPTAWSAPAWWETGLLDRAEWSPARWIASSVVGGPRTTPPASYFRTEFDLPGAVAAARLYVTALGVHEFYLNGQRVSEDVFRPGWTHYDKRVQYDVYDVTALLRAGGTNAAGAILGDGWYSGHVGGKERQQYGERPQFLALLHVTLADGAKSLALALAAARSADEGREVRLT